MAVMTAGLLRRGGSWHGVGVLGVLALAVAAALLLAIAQGAVPVGLGTLAKALAGSADAAHAAVLLELRLPRALLVAMVGAALATSGAALQGLFRNPLADPAFIGISTGAALAVVLALMLGAGLQLALPPMLSVYAISLAAFGGAIAATVFVYRVATRDGRTDIATMLLAGIAVNAVTGAGVGFFVFLSDDQQLRDLQFWLLGSFSTASWDKLLPGALLSLLPALLLFTMAPVLNALSLGEAEAIHLGFEVERAKRAIVALAALSVGAAVALCGVIMFVGLIVPHLLRLCIGPDHRLLLPAGALLGAALLLVADLAARLAVLPAELPIGILTSLIGGPFFLWLLARRRASAGW